VTPVEALAQAIHYLDRAREGGFKLRAYTRALDVLRHLPDGEAERHALGGTLTDLDGIGDSIARLITDVVRTGTSPKLDELARATAVPVSEAAAPYRTALRGDCHLHTTWSDGGASVDAMVSTAQALGHEYLVITDHSARLTVAHGLDRDRLLSQLDALDGLRARTPGIRILSGMEVDILEDGALDLDDDLLARLDVVVASVHSKLRQDGALMTERMLRAVASPHVDILGHCTGRMIDADGGVKRPQSAFDAERVFAACRDHQTAVEINCRPERLDPPDPLLRLAADVGCWFSIDSDAHSTGQLEWQPLGCEMAARCGVPTDRILNTLTADELLAWTRAPGGSTALAK